MRQDLDGVRHSFFLSHVTEDKSEIRRLKAEIDRRTKKAIGRKITCFFDETDWPLLSRNTDILRNELLRSVAMVAWITPDYLAHSQRGWVWIEFALAELIEISNSSPFRLRPYLVPVFRGVTAEQIGRTPWNAFWSRGVFRPDELPEIPVVADRLVKFLKQELS